MEILPNLTNPELLHLYKKMWLIRHFDEKIDEFFRKGIMHGTTHLSIGQEATAVGACAVLTDEDKITSTHRGHGHAIAKGARVDKMMAEMFGKSTGYSKGKGGSMHFSDLEKGNLGSNGIVGGGIPIAVGAALTAKMKKQKDVTISFFGDGATNEGSFHEAVNLASIWKLPVIFFCENNQYGMSSPIDEMINIEHIAERAASYGIPGVIVDGNNLVEVMNATYEAAEHVRMGKGPILIEAKTYRWRGHSKSDKRKYRSREEERFWQTRDPIKQYEGYLINKGILTRETAKKIKLEVRQIMEAAVEFAKRSPKPSIEELYTDVYA
ncbi:thiamine pyrophosphate-dependent dehydrogenase E1 component subunit alpha [Oceanobacillus alkalisoli]|uniref:thiamine pyrophosphate-dependent dehydrogenase E1 component subunit alpha n=1 Tax=Oceanobacillus alkalisoli TaxID=2925113 RepID=UPI001F11B602|nr:thiamine pyrophosphate-dependent dehydrogenase E1 component subunit alpha [Oceanobacillus alkalisoli]MCF3944270.1 thiamine pyrophosphate-dependent dehydrogenase E1 component subunit alpha [Oceanobacillus alkalisoli]